MTSEQMQEKSTKIIEILDGLNYAEIITLLHFVNQQANMLIKSVPLKLPNPPLVGQNQQ